MALLIDTDLLIDLERGDATADVERLLGDEDRALSVITVSELLHGVNRAQGAIRVQRRAFVEHVLAGMEAIAITEPVARVHADIWADLSARGEAIGAHDLDRRYRAGPRPRRRDTQQHAFPAHRRPPRRHHSRLKPGFGLRPGRPAAS